MITQREGVNEVTKCTKCQQEIDKLAVFPGGACVNCYAQSPEGRRMPTAAGNKPLYDHHARHRTRGGPEGPGSSMSTHDRRDD